MFKDLPEGQTNSYMRLNIGCGRDYRKGWVNIDISEDTKADHYLDIGIQPLPFKNETVEEILISGVLEQIQCNHNLLYAMNECWRVLHLGGKITIVVPNAKYSIAHQDPMDIRKFIPATFSYFDKRTKQWQLYGSVYGFKGWSKMGFVENENHILTVTMTK